MNGQAWWGRLGSKLCLRSPASPWIIERRTHPKILLRRKVLAEWHLVFFPDLYKGKNLPNLMLEDWASLPWFWECMACCVDSQSTFLHSWSLISAALHRAFPPDFEKQYWDKLKSSAFFSWTESRSGGCDWEQKWRLLRCTQREAELLSGVIATKFSPLKSFGVKMRIFIRRKPWL